MAWKLAFVQAIVIFLFWKHGETQTIGLLHHENDEAVLNYFTSSQELSLMNSDRSADVPLSSGGTPLMASTLMKSDVHHTSRLGSTTSPSNVIIEPTSTTLSTTPSETIFSGQTVLSVQSVLDTFANDSDKSDLSTLSQQIVLSVLKPFHVTTSDLLTSSIFEQQIVNENSVEANHTPALATLLHTEASHFHLESFTETSLQLFGSFIPTTLSAPSVMITPTPLTSVPEMQTSMTETLDESSTQTLVISVESAFESTSHAAEITVTTATPESSVMVHDQTVDLLQWFVVIIEGNCGLAKAKDEEFQLQLQKEIARWLKLSPDAVKITSISCKRMIHANMTILPPAKVLDLWGVLNDIENSKDPIVYFEGQPFYVAQIKTGDGFINREPDLPIDYKHANVELIIFVALGSTCAFLLLLVAGLLICKYCECCGRKPIDFVDAQNPNVRLEDYTLTQIPRPRVGYLDHCREINTGHYYPLSDHLVGYSGMVQPFDTSVVPLEDAHALDLKMALAHGAQDGVIIKPSNICWLRGHGARYSKNQLDEPCEIDEYVVASTENLHIPTGEKMVDKGIDNPNFE